MSSDADLNCVEARHAGGSGPICLPCNEGRYEDCLWKRPPSWVADHVFKKIETARVFTEPYPFIYVPGILPDEFFKLLRASMPVDASYKTLQDYGRVAAAYSRKRVVVPMNTLGVKNPEKFFFDPAAAAVWKTMMEWFVSEKMLMTVLKLFEPQLQARFPTGTAGVKFHHEALLIRDSEAYELGPHTDSPAKVVSFLYYLPERSDTPFLGTSIYKPKDPSYRCPGGPHHPFALFDRLTTMPFLPNTLFGFVKTNNSFHGVEPVTAGYQRDILLYDIKTR